MKTSSYVDSHIIMGKRNFIGIDSALMKLKYGGEKISVDEALSFVQIPFKKEILLEYKESHILVAVAAMPPAEICALSAEIFYLRNIYIASNVYRKDMSPGWHLIEKTANPIYLKRNWVEQNNRIPDGYKVATVATVVYTMLAHYNATGEYLYKDVRVRCADIPEGRGSGKHVTVSYTGGYILIGECADMKAAQDLGLATEIIPE